MPWDNSPEKRRRDQQTYGSPEYRRNRPVAMRRDKWRCQLRYEGCAGAASQCDHIRSAAEGGGDDVANLRAVCAPCHRRRSAGQGMGARAGQAEDPQPRPKTNW